MELYKKLLKRIEDGSPIYSNETFAKDLEAIAKKHFDQCAINGVGWRSELLPDYDVKEINEIIAECKGNKDDLETLITRIWNKGYITGICFVPEND